MSDRDPSSPHRNAGRPAITCTSASLRRLRWDMVISRPRWDACDPGGDRRANRADLLGHCCRSPRRQHRPCTYAAAMGRQRDAGRRRTERRTLARLSITGGRQLIGTAPGHSPLRSHSRASASFRPSAPVPWTGALRRSVSLSTPCGACPSAFGSQYRRVAKFAFRYRAISSVRDRSRRNACGRGTASSKLISTP